MTSGRTRLRSATSCGDCVDVPDVHADADDLRVVREDRFQHVERPLVDVELERSPRARAASPRFAIR